MKKNSAPFQKKKLLLSEDFGKALKTQLKSTHTPVDAAMATFGVQVTYNGNNSQKLGSRKPIPAQGI